MRRSGIPAARASEIPSPADDIRVRAYQRRVEGPMACLLQQNENSIEIRLEGAINIADAVELKRMLQEAFGSDLELRLELKDATDLDICILQLLCCADRQWRLAHKPITFMGPLTNGASAAAANAGLHELHVAINAGVLCEV